MLIIMREVLKYILVVLFIGGAETSSFAQEQIRIGLHGGDPMTEGHVFIEDGSYAVMADGQKIATLNTTAVCKLVPTGMQIKVYQGTSLLGSFSKVILQSQEWESRFRLTTHMNGKNQQAEVYPDNLLARAYNGKLYLVNDAALERYVAGVTEAESGGGQLKEYYKVQAIIARTYALANMNRHSSEGFNVCDEVHCQAYHGVSRFEPLIPEATWETKDQVLVDPEIRLITAAFHSNCGGHTLNAEHVWSKPLPYLVGRPDTFCLVMPHSHWEKTVPKHHWINYLEKQRGSDVNEEEDSLVVAYYPKERKHYFDDSLMNLRMTSIRRDMDLRSAFFVIEDEGEHVRFTGRGFGHGVGLCQEGAMRMARLGYDHGDILHFYYKEVHLIDKRHLTFFMD